MRKLSLILLILLLISVYADDKKEVVVGSAEELKGIDAKKITWKKDDSEMALIPAGSFKMGNAKDSMRSGQPVHTVELNAGYKGSDHGSSIQAVFSRDRASSIT